MSAAAHFRSGLGRTCVLPALFAGLLALIGLRLVGAPHPWWLAAGAALLRFLHLLATAWARSGLRLDAEGLADVAGGVAIRWRDVEEVRLTIENVPAPGGQQQACRLVTVRGPAGAEVRFGNLGPAFPGRAGAIVNTPAAPLALAVVAERCGCEPLRPASWSAAAPQPAAAAEPAPRLAYRLRQAWGLLPLVFKAGPKALGVALKLAKTINVGTAAVAVAAYSLVLSWQFAAALVFMIAVHECGHVFAMWRSGVAVKAIYFIPFMGGAAVQKGVARTRRASAYIALNGPVWGTLLAAVCLLGHALAGDRLPLLGVLAAWGALLNLFNLLPVLPLDGGRILGSLAWSLHGAVGVGALVCSLLLGAVLSGALGLELLSLMVLVGALELGGQLAALPWRAGLGLLGDRPFGPAERERFDRHTRVVTPGALAEANVAARAEEHELLVREATQVPMRPLEVALTLAGTFLLVGVLVGILLLATHVPGGGDPLDLLR